MLALKKILLAKLETVYGSDPTPTPADNTIDARNIDCSVVSTFAERNNVRADLSPVSGVVAKRYYEIKFECDFKGSGTKGTAPMIGALLQACGMTETASAGSSVTYVPYSVPISTKAVTLYYYEIGDTTAVLRKVTGARGSYELVAEAGSIPVMRFTFRGIYNAPSDETIPTGMAYGSVVPPIVQSGAFTWGANSSLIVKDLNINIDNSLSENPDISSVSGIKGFTIAGRVPKGKFTPEAVSIASFSHDTILTGNTESALSVVIGSASGNKCTITAPKCQIESIGTSEQAGLLYRDLPFRLNRNSGNDELQFLFE